MFLEYTIIISYKKICAFSGLCPMRLPTGRLKSYKYKKSAYGGKKSPARAGKKEISP